MIQTQSALGFYTIYFVLVFTHLVQAGCFREGEDDYTLPTSIEGLAYPSEQGSTMSCSSDFSSFGNGIVVKTLFYNVIMPGVFMICVRAAHQNEYRLTLAWIKNKVMFATYKTSSCEPAKLTGSITVYNIDQTDRIIQLLARIQTGQVSTCMHYTFQNNRVKSNPCTSETKNSCKNPTASWVVHVKQWVINGRGRLDNGWKQVEIKKPSAPPRQHSRPTRPGSYGKHSTYSSFAGSHHHGHHRPGLGGSEGSGGGFGQGFSAGVFFDEIKNYVESATGWSFDSVGNLATGWSFGSVGNLIPDVTCSCGGDSVSYSSGVTQVDLGSNPTSQSGGDNNDDASGCIGAVIEACIGFLASLDCSDPDE
ncbi:uncharacterized protein LOC129001112 isoform X1 [Macrosteles quadrilineatus]|uniref:uncharacterized protein LOC129001112 isoform X1 n=1 Tax=Macrosteles quadrilineatus TaxID=74068 RepID=UPI0023E2B355|nr:uncharacterized protein LOC129001112 isoform X1 [Macrosteles quadrilineatus]